VFIYPLIQPGLIVGGDWTSPYTNKQLHVYADSASTIWSNREIPTGTQTSHKNSYPFNLLAGLFSSIGMSGESFQKITLFLTIIGIYYFSYLFLIRITNNKTASLFGALSYLLSPLIYNYLNMGWNFVLLFMALSPLFAITALNFFTTGKIKYAIILGFIFTLGFAQSQSFIWFLIIYLFIFICQIKPKENSKNFKLFTLGLFIMLTTLVITNAPWIITSMKYMDSSFMSTTSFDVDRFSAVFSVLNSFRGWGSLFNQQYEIAFPPTLILFSIYPIVLIIYQTIINKNVFLKKYYLLSICLILVSPIIYLLRTEIAHIPFSTIIRDGSRFLVITSLGLSMGISLALSQIKNKLFYCLTIICLVFSVYPFFSNGIYSTSKSSIDKGILVGKDFRLRLLNIPMNSYEDILKKYSNQSNLLVPTGGSTKTKTDKRFMGDFWEVYDNQALFSPYSSGIYFSDKSNPLVINFVYNLVASGKDIKLTEKILGIYGINNIFLRSRLESIIQISSPQKTITSECVSTKENDSDWSITEICPIKNPYPQLFLTVSPIYSTDSLTDILTKQIQSDDLNVIIGCPKGLENDSEICGPNKPYTLSNTVPSIKITSLSPTKYKVDITNISDKFILVLNKTFHQGWRILDINGKVQKFDHILINQLVNGWIINPIQGTTTTQYLIEFYPQEIYSMIFPFSATIFLVLTLYVIYAVILKK